MQPPLLSATRSQITHFLQQVVIEPKELVVGD
jgi:hypothetical protein